MRRTKQQIESTPVPEIPVAAPDLDAAFETPEPVNGAAFDLDALRLPQDFEALSGVKRLLLTVPIRRPNPQSFVRVLDTGEPEFRTHLLVLKEDREQYLVAPALWDVLHQELTPHILAIAIDRQGVTFVWPLRVPATDRPNTWHASALQAAQLAKRQWIRMQANMALGAYDVYAASGQLDEPTWPELPISEIYKLAFKDRYIGAFDHPVLKRLRGEV